MEYIDSVGDEAELDEFVEIELRNQKCREMEVKFSAGEISAEELFSAYYDLMCIGGYWAYNYAPEVNRARRLMSIIDPAFKTKLLGLNNEVAWLLSHKWSDF